MNKRAAELTLNVIIIAVLVLLVLAILAFIFTGRISIFGKGLKDCNAVGGKCEGRLLGDADKPTSVECPKGVGQLGTNCEKSGLGCCISLD